jgi:hypothetical protein
MENLVPMPVPERDGSAQTEATQKSSSGQRSADDLAEAIVLTAVGVVVLAVEAVEEAVRAAASLPDRAEEREPGAVALAMGATAGWGLGVMRGVRAAAGGARRTFGDPAMAAAETLVERPSRAARAALERWRAIWTSERERVEPLAASFASETTRRASDAILDQLDLTSIVCQRVDLDAVVDGLDIERITRRLDLDTLVAGLDVDRIVARVDLDAVIERVDVAEVVRDVMERLDVPEIIRQSTAATASEGVRGVRLRGVDADRAVRRAVDRLLSRTNDGSKEKKA